MHYTVQYKNMSLKICACKGKDHISSAIRNQTIHDSDIIQELETYADKEKIFIDVGAYLGTWSLPLAGFFDRVIAFEPQKIPFEMLSESISLNDARIDPYNIALGSKQSRGMVTNNIHTNLAGSKIHQVKGGDITISTLDHEVKSIGLHPKDIGLIKIDVEGMELDVLKGSEYVLSDGSPYVYVEFHEVPGIDNMDIRIDQFMEDRQYERVRTFEKDKILYGKIEDENQ